MLFNYWFHRSERPKIKDCLRTKSVITLIKDGLRTRSVITLIISNISYVDDTSHGQCNYYNGWEDTKEQTKDQ